MVGVSRAAIKMVSIPRDASEIHDLRLQGLNKQQTRTYLEKLVKDFGAEIRTMEAVKGYTNIVSIEDYVVVEQPAVPQWHVLIRMELLKPMDEHFSRRTATEACRTLRFPSPAPTRIHTDILRISLKRRAA